MSVAHFTITNTEVKDLGKPLHACIDTGLGFLDHMIDQFNSHAQVGVSIQVTSDVGVGDVSNKNRHAGSDQFQELLMGQVGLALGEKFNLLIQQSYSPIEIKTKKTSRFCCPLDEALVECVLITDPIRSHGILETFNLSPYGTYPLKTGRTQIGQMKTAFIKTFFHNIALSSGLEVHFVKVRGKNGHHIIESAFKAFSRAFRNLLDGVDTTHESLSDDLFKIQRTDTLWGIHSSSFRESISKERGGSSRRSTKETSIDVDMKLDGGEYGVSINTGIKMLDSFFTVLSREAMMSLSVQCCGDLWVDDHHSSEDVAIAVGKNLNESLGTKAGLNRMWCSEAKYGQAHVEAVIDLSNRPCLSHNLSLEDNIDGDEYAGDLSIEMFEHVLDSLVMNGQMTVHLLQKCDSSTCVSDLVMAVGMAFGRTLRYCMAVDPRRAGVTASSKGTLSA